MGGEWAVGAASDELEYQLWVNNTGDMGRLVDNGLDGQAYAKGSVYGKYQAVQQAIDAAIIGHKAQLTESADIQVGVGRLAELPTPEGSINPVGSIVVVASGDIFFTLGCSLSAILVLQTIAAEKEAGLLAALRVVGLREWLHWLSWALCYILPCLLSAILSTCSGLVLGIRLFSQCDFTVHVLLMFLFLQSFAAFATFLGSFLSKTRSVVIASMITLFVAVLSNSILKSMEFVGGRAFHYGSNSDWLPFLCLSAMPWFHFQRVFNAIAGAAYQSDINQDQYFNFGDLGSAPSYAWTNDRNEQVYRNEYAAGSSLLIQIFLVVMYNCFAWYFGQIASADEGSAQPIHFCFLPRYWGGLKGTGVFDDDDGIGREQSLSRSCHSVRFWAPCPEFFRPLARICP